MRRFQYVPLTPTGLSWTDLRAEACRISTKPVVCRSGMPNSTFIVRQIWIAASLNSGCRPRLPVGGACHDISGANQIDREPRLFSDVLYEGQFLVLYFVGDQLLMAASYHHGFKQ